MNSERLLVLSLKTTYIVRLFLKLIRYLKGHLFQDCCIK